MISPRYAAIVSVLLALPLWAVITHSYVGATLDDGRVARAISQQLADLAGSSTDRSARWGKDVFGTDDWIERRYVGQDGTSVRLFVARSYDLKRLYHRPEHAALYGIDLESRGMTRLGTEPPIPAFRLSAWTGNGMAAYVILYDGQFVENPVALQLRSAWELLFSPRKAMTLFLAYDAKASPAQPLSASPIADVLLDAVASFRAQGRYTSGDSGQGSPAP